ncbi:MAG: LPS export ABC transporter periplasmic protein LptC [Bryobacteraceae bacterium]|nr:LPS export ABC transporter periplasmic protein LptC [Bryobacteraceae bacterium]MDW8379147.1 LptA/OstA family protein [Bryobacterales bacterium]
MRRIRPLFLISILGICVYLAYTYRLRVEEQRRNAPPPPPKLPPRVRSTAESWRWEKSSENGGPAVSVKAKDFKALEEPSRFELEKVELKICSEQKGACDLVTSDHAEFDLAASSLYSEGEADITMGIPTEETQPLPAGRIVRIRSSGIRFDSKTGKAETDREVTFELEKGQGRAIGAQYDPATRELILRSQAELIWKDQGPKPRPMKVEAGHVVYKEAEAKVYLSPWSKFSRDTMVLEGKAATVTLDKDGIRLVETTDAKGSDTAPHRKIEYAAGELTLHFSANSEIERIVGRTNARLVTTATQAVTTVETNQVEMEFEAHRDDSVLKKVTARGASRVHSKPLPAGPGRAPLESKSLRSEVIELAMRPGGQEIETMDAPLASVLEFLPQAPNQKQRRIEGEAFHFAYAPGNQLESFRARKATTRTENPPKDNKPGPPAITNSAELAAEFNAQGELARLEQWGDFRYQEGERRARAERAIFQPQIEQFMLVQQARLWDPQGATSADEIVLDQRTEDFRAEGNVQSSQTPNQKGGGTAMLSREEPIQAKAARMWTRQRQTVITYEGQAVLWQGASRLQADRIEIDRARSLLLAYGGVFSQLLDQPSDAPRSEPSNSPKNRAARPGSPVFTLIRASSLVYSDQERMAHYSGGVSLKRGDLDVKSQQLRAFFKDSSQTKPGESSLERAVADGSVLIIQDLAGRTKRGSSEHAEYFVAEGRVVLEGGQPQLEDSVQGLTRGKQLIYYANDDRLLVNGVPQHPAVSKVRRK